jgi:hypothetical protein
MLIHVEYGDTMSSSGNGVASWSYRSTRLLQMLPGHRTWAGRLRCSYQQLTCCCADALLFYSTPLIECEDNIFTEQIASDSFST